MCKNPCNHSGRNKEMKRVSVRTLVLLMELFVAVLGHQYIAWTPPARVEVLWVAPEINEAGNPPPETARTPCATANREIAPAR